MLPVGRAPGMLPLLALAAASAPHLTPAEFRDAVRGGRVAEFACGVPKVLHQTWKSRSVLPRHRRYAESWARCLGADWLRVLWTDADAARLVAEEAPEFRRVFESYPHPIQRADSFRYALLRTHGGFYADLDNECLSEPQLPPHPSGGSCGFYLAQQPRKAAAGWIERRRYTALAREHGLELDVSSGGPKGVVWPVMNSLMASRPAHPFWTEVLRSAARVAAERGSNSGVFGGVVSRGTGVTLLTDAFFAHRSRSADGCVLGLGAWNGEEDEPGAVGRRYVAHRSTAVWRTETVQAHVADRVRLLGWVAAGVGVAAAVRDRRAGARRVGLRAAGAAAAVLCANYAAHGALAAAYRYLRSAKLHDVVYEYAATLSVAAADLTVLWCVLSSRRDDAARRDDCK